MDSSLKQRLVGALVLIALAVIFLPMLVKGPAPDSGVSDVSLDLPAEPAIGAETRDLPLTVPAATPPAGALGMEDAAPAAEDAVQGGLFPATAAGDYAVSFGSYASEADADKVIAALRSAELPAYREATTVNGKPAQRVRIGPFADRALAESARLRAGHVNDTVGAKVLVLDAVATAPVATTAAAPPAASAQVAPLPAAPKPAAAVTPAAQPAAATSGQPAATTAVAPVKPAAPAAAKPADTSGTGFVVQVGAFVSAADAGKLRDRLRALGFNAFTDTAPTEKGTLTRVRVGPAMNRAEADGLKAQVKAKAGIDGIVRPHP